MTEKIEWYKEIMELEPNSKVFFPLAKLLVEDNDAMQAIEVLEKGLERHPDYMEARLFLIELMYRNGLNEDCSRQVQKLSSLLARYAGFWQAWAACLSASPGEEDTASIVRFLAAHFLVGPLQINEVLNLGLAEIVKRYHNREEADSSAAALLQKDSNSTNSLNIQTTESGKFQDTAISTEKQLDVDAHVAEDLKVEPDKANSSEEETVPESVGAAINLETLPSMDFETPDKLENISTEHLENPETQPVQTTLLSTPEIEAESTVGLMTSATDQDQLLGDESFSLRTRSMAEVLSDQGDYKGALEIYEELAESEKNPEEIENIHTRMEELKALVNIRSIPEDEPIQMDPPYQKKERLLGILEALAKRVEARMHN